MEMLTKGGVLALLRTGSPAARRAFLAGLPPSGLKDTAADLISSDQPGMVVVSLGPTIMEYCNGRNPEIGAVLAAAAHERSLEIVKTVPNHGLIPTTLSGLAYSHLKALALLGRSEEVLAAAAGYIEFYERLGEQENLPSLKVLRIEAMVNLRQLDDAHEALREEALLRHPIAGIEAKRLKVWVDRYRRDPRLLKSELPDPETASSLDMLNAMKTAAGLGVGGEAGKLLQKLVEDFDPNNRFDPTDPQQFKHLLETLNQADAVLTKGGQDSDLVVRAKIRNASSIFVHGTPATETIQGALVDLEESLDWARRNKVSELENDALWGIYLCNGRLGQHSRAADALIELRGRLESLRRGIKDPLKRGGIFGTYRYLFNVLCEQLQKCGRSSDLLMAIESSKGRVIADRLTAQTEDVVEDSAIYGCVAGLPELVRRERFHYLTYFVDEACVYAAFVSKDGEIHAVEPVRMRDTELRSAAAHVDPRRWSDAASDASARLAPLVAWLDTLLAQGVVEEGDHICYASDDDFSNIPLHYLRFRDGLLLDYFSVSRVHSAFHLHRILSRSRGNDFDRFAGFVVPMRQDMGMPGADAFLKNLDAPVRWLQDHGLLGTPVRLAEATLERVKSEPLDGRVVQFSTHGHFPGEAGNPFYESFLLLADEKGLPDSERVSRGEHKGTLTPSGILDAKLNFEHSHVSMMACVSGLAKEGLAGDALGLDWALIQAGASSLLSTHWNVSAACAALFLNRFYAKWIEDEQPRAAAFRKTMRELLREDHTQDSLWQWTAFSLTGDFR